MRLLLIGLIGLGLVGLARGDDPAKKDKEAKGKKAAVAVPYRLTETQHVMVRVKLNGKGPFNFIVDTGAPVSFVSIPIGKKIGLEKTDKKMSVLDKLEFEGGLTLNKVKIVVETPFQLEGMNGMGLAGVELHGIIGYTELARYRMEFDFTRDKLYWTPLDFDPPPPMAIGAKGATGGLEMIGGLMKFLGGLAGFKPAELPEPRGFLGVWLEEKGKDLVIKHVLKGSSAEGAKLQKGDRILEINGRIVEDLARAQEVTGKVLPGDEVRFTIRRGEKEIELAVRAASGL